VKREQDKKRESLDGLLETREGGRAALKSFTTKRRGTSRGTEHQEPSNGGFSGQKSHLGTAATIETYGMRRCESPPARVPSLRTGGGVRWRSPDKDSQPLDMPPNA
jgi:hypothetical protein